MMAQNPEENSTTQAGDSEAKSEVTLGAVLREAREHFGLSVADVANQIKFAPRQIEAIEADDYKHLPEEAFLRGFIRSYAKILQLDAEKLLDALPHSKAKTGKSELVPPSVGVPFPGANSLLRQNTVLLVAAAVLALIAGGFAIWNAMSPIKRAEVSKVETPVALPAEAQSVPAAPAAVEQVAESTEANAPKAKTKPESVKPETKSQNKDVAKPDNKPAVKPEGKPLEMLGLTPSLTPETKTRTKPEVMQEPKPEVKPPESKPEPKPEAKPVEPAQSLPATTDTQSVDATPVTQLRLEFGEESWTEIRDRDDKILSSQVNPAGSELVIYGRAPFTMLIGHGLSARLYHQGKQVDLTPYINKYSEVAHVTLQ